jgi:hypothetical protein
MLDPSFWDAGPPSATVVGRLPDDQTSSGYRIAPFVVWANDVSAVRVNPDEVAFA